MLQIRYAIIFVLIGFFVLQIVRGKISIIEVYAFFIPFFGIDYDIGIRFTLSQFLLLILNCIFFIQLFSNIKVNFLKGLNKNVVIFLFYAFTSAFILSTFVIDFIQTRNPGFLRNEGRYISQIINYSLLFSVFYIIYNHLKTKQKFLRILKYFLSGIFLLSILGLLQQIVYVTTSIDILPLPTGTGDIRISQTFDYFGLPLIRICSLAGEPKSFGMFLALGIVVIKILNNLSIKLIQKQTVVMYFMLALLVLTLSTSGFVLLTILWIVAELVLRFSGVLPRMSIFSFFSGLAFVFTLLFFSEPLENVIQDRIIERDITNEDFDAVVKDFLLDNPQWLVFGSGMGNIHNLAANYIPDQLNYFMEDNIFVAKSGYLRLISETGIVGFILFALFNLSIISKNFYLYTRTKQKIVFFIALSSVLLFLAYMARGFYVAEAYLFFLAIANTLNLRYKEWGLILPEKL